MHFNFSAEPLSDTMAPTLRCKLIPHAIKNSPEFRLITKGEHHSLFKDMKNFDCDGFTLQLPLQPYVIQVHLPTSDPCELPDAQKKARLTVRDIILKEIGAVADLGSRTRFARNTRSLDPEVLQTGEEHVSAKHNHMFVCGNKAALYCNVKYKAALIAALNSTDDGYYSHARHFAIPDAAEDVLLHLNATINTEVVLDALYQAEVDYVTVKCYGQKEPYQKVAARLDGPLSTLMQRDANNPRYLGRSVGQHCLEIDIGVTVPIADAPEGCDLFPLVRKHFMPGVKDMPLCADAQKNTHGWGPFTDGRLYGWVHSTDTVAAGDCLPDKVCSKWKETELHSIDNPSFDDLGATSTMMKMQTYTTTKHIFLKTGYLGNINQLPKEVQVAKRWKKYALALLRAYEKPEVKKYVCRGVRMEIRIRTNELLALPVDDLEYADYPIERDFLPEVGYPSAPVDTPYMQELVRGVPLNRRCLPGTRLAGRTALSHAKDQMMFYLYGDKGLDFLLMDFDEHVLPEVNATLAKMANCRPATEPQLFARRDTEEPDDEELFYLAKLYDSLGINPNQKGWKMLRDDKPPRSWSMSQRRRDYNRDTHDPHTEAYCHHHLSLTPFLGVKPGHANYALMFLVHFTPGSRGRRIVPGGFVNREAAAKFVFEKYGSEWASHYQMDQQALQKDETNRAKFPGYGELDVIIDEELERCVTRDAMTVYRGTDGVLDAVRARLQPPPKESHKRRERTVLATGLSASESQESESSDSVSEDEESDPEYRPRVRAVSNSNEGTSSAHASMPYPEEPSRPSASTRSRKRAA